MTPTFRLLCIYSHHQVQLSDDYYCYEVSNYILRWEAFIHNEFDILVSCNVGGLFEYFSYKCSLWIIWALVQSMLWCFFSLALPNLFLLYLHFVSLFGVHVSLHLYILLFPWFIQFHINKVLHICSSSSFELDKIVNDTGSTKLSESRPVNVIVLILNLDNWQLCVE